MRAEPRRHLDGRVRFIYGASDSIGMWLELEITDPPSSAGRSVDLYLTDDEMEQVMMECRRRAIARRSRRSRPMEGHTA